MRKKIWMEMASLVALAIVNVTATSCAVVTPNGELSGNGRFWSRVGKATDRVALPQPYMAEDAYLADEDFGGNPPQTCPGEATAASLILQEPAEHD